MLERSRIADAHSGVHRNSQEATILGRCCSTSAVRAPSAVSSVPLTAAQAAALEHVQTLAERDRATATERAAMVLARAGIELDVGELCALIAERGRVVVNFHRDRIASDGRTVLGALSEDGLYRNQFETGISNGGLGAVRERFEEQLFAGTYAQAGVLAVERPKYGGLDLVGHLDGPCPRFGSCHLRLRREVLFRFSFSFGDSVTEPDAVGTIEVFEPVLAALLDAIEAGGHTSAIGSCSTVLGLEAPSVSFLVALLRDGPQQRRQPGRALDDYIEAQVHGPLRLADDVEALVADPSFRQTTFGAQLEGLARTFGFSLFWHPGFVLDADEVPAHFRGPEVRTLGCRIAAELGDGTGRLDAEVLGRAARLVVADPDHFADHGTPVETLQHLKQLWHVLVAYGHPVG